MSLRLGCFVLLASTAAVCHGAAVAQVVAQVVLPEIVVSAPSPIAPPRTDERAVAPGTLPIVDQAFVPVTVVTTEELTRAAGGTLGDVLLTKPGITGSSFAPGAASRPIIRGLDNYRVRIQENGLAVNDVSDLSEDHAVPIDPGTARQIEVIRGPATLRWGSQAIGGVVNVENGRIPTALPPRGFRLETRGGANSAESGVDAAMSLDAGKGNFAIHADVHGRTAGNYAIPSYPYLFPPAPTPVVDGRQPNSWMNAHGHSVGGSYLFDGGFVGVSVAHFASLYGIPGIEATETGTRIDMRQTKVAGRGEYRPSGNWIDAIRFSVGASDYKHDEMANEGGGDEIHQTFTNRSQEGRVEVQFAPFDLRFGALTTAIGMQGAHEQLAAPGHEGGLLDPSSTRSAAAFVFNELKLTDTLRVQVAGRIESVQVDGSAPIFPLNYLPPPNAPPSALFQRDFLPKSAALGVLKDLPGGLVASVSAQYVERAPRAPELFSRGIHEATGTFEIGDPTLGIESAQTIEAGLRRAQGSFRFDATVFHTWFSSFIYKRLTGNTCDEAFDSCIPGPGAELDQVVYSQRNAKFRGAELQAQLDVAPLGPGVWGVDGQYDIVRARFADGSNVPRIPPQRIGGGVFWRGEGWFARVGLLHAFAQRSVAPNETTTDAYNLLKAEVSHTRRLPGDGAGEPREITLGIVGNNLLNDDVRNAVSFKKDEVLLPGRTVRLFARVVF